MQLRCWRGHEALRCAAMLSGTVMGPHPVMSWLANGRVSLDAETIASREERRWAGGRQHGGCQQGGCQHDELHVRSAPRRCVPSSECRAGRRRQVPHNPDASPGPQASAYQDAVLGPMPRGSMERREQSADAVDKVRGPKVASWINGYPEKCRPVPGRDRLGAIHAQFTLIPRYLTGRHFIIQERTSPWAAAICSYQVEPHSTWWCKIWGRAAAK